MPTCGHHNRIFLIANLNINEPLSAGAKRKIAEEKRKESEERRDPEDSKEKEEEEERGKKKREKANQVLPLGFDKHHALCSLETEQRHEDEPRNEKRKRKRAPHLKTYVDADADAAR